MSIGAFSILSICIDDRIGQKVYPLYPFSKTEKLPIEQRTYLSSPSLSGKVWETVHAIQKKKGAQSNTLAGLSTLSVSRKVPNKYALCLSCCRNVLRLLCVAQSQSINYFMSYVATRDNRGTANRMRETLLREFYYQNSVIHVCGC